MSIEEDYLKKFKRVEELNSIFANAQKELVIAETEANTAKERLEKAKAESDYEKWKAEQAVEMARRTAVVLETLGTDPVTEYVALTNRRRELEAGDKEIGQKAFALESRKLFFDFPLLTEFSWRQESDYFNDGEATPFSSNHKTPEVNGDSESQWHRPSRSDPLGPTIAAVRRFMEQYTDGDVMNIFGDKNVEVTVTRDGIKTCNTYN